MVLSILDPTGEHKLNVSRLSLSCIVADAVACVAVAVHCAMPTRQSEKRSTRFWSCYSKGRVNRLDFCTTLALYFHDFV